MPAKQDRNSLRHCQVRAQLFTVSKAGGAKEADDQKNFRPRAKEVFRIFRIIWEYRYDWKHEFSVVRAADDRQSMNLKQRLKTCKRCLKKLYPIIHEARQAAIEANIPAHAVRLGVQEQRELDSLTQQLGEHARIFHSILRVLGSNSADKLDVLAFECFEKVERQLRVMTDQIEQDNMPERGRQSQNEWEMIVANFLTTGVSRRDIQSNKAFIDAFIERLLETDPLDESERLAARYPYPPLDPSNRRYDPRADAGESSGHHGGNQVPHARHSTGTIPDGGSGGPMNFESNSVPQYPQSRSTRPRSESQTATVPPTLPLGPSVTHSHRDDHTHGDRIHHVPSRPPPQLYPTSSRPQATHSRIRASAQLMERIRRASTPPGNHRGHSRSRSRLPFRAGEVTLDVAWDVTSYAHSDVASYGSHNSGSSSPSTQTSGLASNSTYSTPYPPNEARPRYTVMRQQEDARLHRARSRSRGRGEEHNRTTQTQEGPTNRERGRRTQQQLEADEREAKRAEAKALNDRMVRYKEEELANQMRGMRVEDDRPRVSRGQPRDHSRGH